MVKGDMPPYLALTSTPGDWRQRRSMATSPFLHSRCTRVSPNLFLLTTSILAAGDFLGLGAVLVAIQWKKNCLMRPPV